MTFAPPLWQVFTPPLTGKRLLAFAEYRLGLGEAVLIVLPKRARGSFSG